MNDPRGPCRRRRVDRLYAPDITLVVPCRRMSSMRVFHAASAERHQGDHRGRADNDAEHRQHRTQFLQPQVRVAKTTKLVTRATTAMRMPPLPDQFTSDWQRSSFRPGLLPSVLR